MDQDYFNIIPVEKRREKFRLKNKRTNFTLLKYKN